MEERFEIGLTGFKGERGRQLSLFAAGLDDKLKGKEKVNFIDGVQRSV